MLFLAQATDAANTLWGLTVTEWILLLGFLGSGVMAALKWLEARATKREAHELALAKLEAEQERDAAFEGIERGGHPRTKMEVREAALAKGIDDQAFSAKVRKATSRITPTEAP